MKQRLLRVFLAVVIGSAFVSGVVWLLIHTLGDTDPLFQGKSLAYWIGEVRQGGAASNRTCLVLDQEIIPQLTRIMLLDTNDSRLRLALIEKLNTLPGVNIYVTTAPTRRMNAAMLLGEFGPAAKG